MERICKGVSEEECFKMAVEKYESQLMDKQAISQAKWRPLHQAMLVLKWLYGYGGPHRTRATRTMSHDKDLCEKWNKIVKLVKQHYSYQSNDEVNPELLGEMNLYAINLIMEKGLD